MRRLSRPLPFLALTLMVALAGSIACCFLPHDRYILFQTVAAESDYSFPLKWIYERIYDDPTAIDIAFVGTSHTQSGVNSAVVESTLRAHGDPAHVVNFALPFLGRDLEYLIVKELLTTRTIRQLVIELQESEPIYPHPAFQRLADPADILSAPMLLNTGYLLNLVTLPQRQVSLFARSCFPSLFGLHPAFAPADYAGPHWDDTYAMHTRQGFDNPRTAVHPPAFFDPYVLNLRRAAAENQALARWLEFLPFRHNLLYRYNWHYLEAMIALAQQHKVGIVFLYLPSFNGPDSPDDVAAFSRLAPVLVPRQALENAALWQNVGHFNAAGAEELSRWLGTMLSQAPGHPLPTEAPPIRIPSAIAR
jgi:hypothetical protein